MNYDMGTPEGRLAAAESLTPEEYNRAMDAYRRRAVVCTVNGHDIRTAGSRFGLLYAVGDTGRAFMTMEAARACANSTPKPEKKAS